MIKYLLTKYLRSSESFGFIELTKWLAFIGIALGVCVLLISMAVMNGMNESFASRLLSMNYPLTLYPRTQLANTHDATFNALTKYQPSEFLQAQVAIKNGSRLDGAVIFGVDFAKEILINPVLAKAIKSQAILESKSPQDLANELNQGFNLIVGKKILEQFSPLKDGKLALIFNELRPNALTLAPLFKRFNVRGSFTSGLSAYDSSYIFTNLESLQKILKSQNISGIHLSAKEPKAAKIELERLLGEKFIIVGWWEQNASIIAAMELEKRALFFILFMLVLIAALNIVTSMLMIVLNRRKEIAILLALGASTKEIKASFFATGFAIGLAGVLCGCILASIGIWLLSSFAIISLPEDVYGSATLPINLSALDASCIIFGALFISALAAYYPACKAAKTDILSTLREE